MTRADIVAELRRSACEDVWPFWNVSDDAFHAVRKFHGLRYLSCNSDELRLLFLLTAQALDQSKEG